MSPGRAEVAVVIPACNEGDRIDACLASLGAFFDAGDPVLVVDDGSSDGTARIAARRGALVLPQPRSRRGHAVARGYAAVAGRADCVLIIHADMIVPARARARLLDALGASPGAVGGVLGHRIDDPRVRFRCIEFGNRLRAHYGQLPYGDQAQFMRTAAVARAGGFPQQPDLEDIELSLRLRRAGRWVYADCPVLIPNRHWRHGVVRTTLRNWRAAIGYRWRRWRTPWEEPSF